jgi:hypothetical protein
MSQDSAPPTAASADVDTLPPTQYLILETLAARLRLGETRWPFPRRLLPALNVLENLGLLWFESDVAPGVYRAALTAAGRGAILRATYKPPISELLTPCPEPGIADGRDLCPCGSGEVWPCKITRAAWLTAGLDPDAEMRKVLDAAKAAMAAEHAEWEALNEEDPDAARRYALRRLGW